MKSNVQEPEIGLAKALFYENIADESEALDRTEIAKRWSQQKREYRQMARRLMRRLEKFDVYLVERSNK